MSSLNFFTQLGGMIDSIIDPAMNVLSSQWVSGLTTIIQASITLYILFFGYSVLAGKIQMPIPDLIWNVSRWALIFMFVSNANGWLDLSVNAVNDIKSFLSGSDNLYTSIDNRVNDYVAIATLIMKQIQGAGVMNFSIIIFQAINFILTLPLLIGIVLNGIVVIISDVCLKVLIATAPLFIFCLMWGFLRDMFAQWLQAIVGNCLIILFVNVFVRLGMQVATYAANLPIDNWDLTKPLAFLIAGALTIAACKFGREMGISLSKISIERTASGASFQAGIKNTASDVASPYRAGKIAGASISKGLASPANAIKNLIAGK